MISYAQNFEDVMLARAFRNRSTGFYADIGAWDPDLHSVTKHFYDLGWTGINVEPNPVMFDRLTRKRPRDRNLCCAAGGEDVAHGTFYLFENEGISTFRKEFAAEFAKHFPVSETHPEVRTLADILTDVPEIHFLKIDVEGAESSVLRSCDWNQIRPWIILIEAVDPITRKPDWSNWEFILLENKYEFVYFDGLNRFYVAAEHRELSPEFSSPPNVFDEFTRASEALSAEQAQRLTAEINQTLLTVEEISVRLAKIIRSGREIPADLTHKLQYLRELTEEADQFILSLQQRASRAEESLKEAEKAVTLARIWVGQVAEQRAAAEIRARAEFREKA